MTDPDETFLLLNASNDGELSPGEALAMQRRLTADPSLRAMAERLGALSVALRPALETAAAPDALRARILREIGFSEAPARPKSMPRHWQQLAAVLLVGLAGGAVLGSGATYVGFAPGDAATVDAVVAGHLRGLVAQQPFDIASSNRHVVKPWFNGRTTIAPDTPDFADQGFPLAGGRIDVVDGKPVPTLVYRHDQHVISVTITPRSAPPAGDDHRGGSTVEHWTAGDLTYWVVSDIDARELQAFTTLFRARTSNAG